MVRNINYFCGFNIEILTYLIKEIFGNTHFDKIQIKRNKDK